MRVLRVLILAALIFLAAGRVHALKNTESQIQVKFADGNLQVKAAQASLRDVLQQIAEKTGIALEAAVPLEEQVSCDIETTAVEAAIKQLLEKRSYSLTFSKTEDGRFSPEKLQVLSAVGCASLAPLDSAQEITVINDSVDLSGQHSVEKQFLQESESLVEEGAKRGLQVVEVSQDSPLAGYGLEKGDVVDDINGQVVKTIDDFTRIMQAMPAEQKSIRISRWREDGVLDPIYYERK